MANRRGGMSPAQRAKQFMPFAAVKGLEEALERMLLPDAACAQEKPSPAASMPAAILAAEEQTAAPKA